jgi:hypothetical protein
MRDLRKSKGGISEVQALPNLLQDFGQRGEDPGSQEGKLVNSVGGFGCDLMIRKKRHKL